ncbi:hypothetical protein [Streptomyces sp. NPDC008139]|uniref:hypothetical protein n=1 Tax=Streptomyces sp. NPDC008139 TaxID=3364814 RepID=UPI0036E0F1CB
MDDDALVAEQMAYYRARAGERAEVVGQRPYQGRIPRRRRGTAARRGPRTDGVIGVTGGRAGLRLAA